MVWGGAWTDLALSIRPDLRGGILSWGCSQGTLHAVFALVWGSAKTIRLLDGEDQKRDSSSSNKAFTAPW